MLDIRQVNYDPVFVHSGFRSASTWLWARFRDQSSFLAYYEIFNEDLATLTPKDIGKKSSESWRSRHPASAPYYLEFLPLLDAKGGVASFAPEAEFGVRFVPVGGLGGDLPAEEIAYIATLIDSATASGRTPVLTCTRTLGRIAALKKNFGGTHILLRRNLFHQWNSFSGQHRTGNLYFVASVLFIIFNNRIDSFFQYLVSFLPTLAELEIQSVIEENYDDVFAIFIAWHIYLLIHAERHADIVVDVNRLSDSRDPHRAMVEQALEAVTGRFVSLDNARNAIDLPWKPIADLHATRIKVEMLVERACAELQASTAERSVVTGMLNDLWQEHERFTLYTTAALEQIAEATGRNHVLTEALKSAEVRRVAETEHQMEQISALEKSVSDYVLRIAEERKNAGEARFAADARIGVLQQTTEQVRAALAIAEADRDSAIAAAARDAAERQAERERMVAEIDHLKRSHGEDVSRLGLDLEDARIRAADFAEKLAEAERNIARQKASFEVVVRERAAERDALQEQIEMFDRRITALISERNTALKNLDVSRAEILAYSAALAAAHAEARAITAALDDLNMRAGGIG